MKKTIKVPTIRSLASLIRTIKSDISDESRADEYDEKPGICLTVGADESGWNYQTGDNSYSGGAYHYSYWGVVSVYRSSNSRELAKDCIGEILDAAAYSEV